jgi:hypothetical protein
VAKSTAFAGKPPDQPEVSLDELLALDRAFKFPLPPDGAEFVRFESGWRAYEGKGKKDTPLDYLGFLLKPAKANHPAVALAGTRELTLKSTKTKITPVIPDPALARDRTIKENEEWRRTTSHRGRRRMTWRSRVPRASAPAGAGTTTGSTPRWPTGQSTLSSRRSIPVCFGH